MLTILYDRLNHCRRLNMRRIRLFTYLALVLLFCRLLIIPNSEPVNQYSLVGNNSWQDQQIYPIMELLMKIETPKTEVKKEVKIRPTPTLPKKPIFTYSKSYYVDVRASAYCPCEICCEEFADGETSTGRDASLPGVAVPDNDLLPLGAYLDIPGYGSKILCDDKGGAIKKTRIDVRFNDHDEALRWEIQYIRVKVYIP